MQIDAMGIEKRFMQSARDETDLSPVDSKGFFNHETNLSKAYMSLNPVFVSRPRPDVQAAG